MTSRDLRVLPIPSAHAYPQSLRRRDVSDEDGGAGPADVAVRHLPDPPVPGAPADVWWPPPALDAAWVDQHADEIDLVHLHFGFDASNPDDLIAWCDALERHRIPLVLTVHDLVNPHFVDQAEHQARLDVLVLRAQAVLTLTSSAARRIRERWGRDATVLPHPHVAPLGLVGRAPQRTPDAFVVGLHLKSLRANVDPLPVVDAILAALTDLPGAVLRVHLHHEVVDPSHPRHDAPLVARLETLAEEDSLELVLHEPHSDDELWDYLRSLDLSVLAYTFGTHSGWLEACHDLGTPVLAPRTGLWGEQQRTFAYDRRPDGSVDAVPVAVAVSEAYRARPTWQATRDDRERQQAEVAWAHEAIYRRAVADLAGVDAREEVPA